jgi:hypothetical protein
VRGPIGIYGCCWPSPARSFSGQSTTVFITILYYLKFENSPNWRIRFPSQLYSHFYNIRRAIGEVCSEMWNLGTNSAFAQGLRRTAENPDWIGWPQDLPDANWLLPNGLALNIQNQTLVPKCAEMPQIIPIGYITLAQHNPPMRVNIFQTLNLHTSET